MLTTRNTPARNLTTSNSNIPQPPLPSNGTIRSSNITSLTHAFKRAAETIKYRAKMAQYLNDPVLWMKDRINVDIWSKQKEVSQSLVDNKKTAVKACQGVGKTQIAAYLICWWIDVHADDEVLVVTTAPTDHQVKKLLWGYIRELHRKHGLRGTVNEAAEWKSGDRDFIAYGRKPADTNLSAFQGAHRKYLLAVIDEAGGVPASIWEGVDAITTMDTNRVLAIGNPTDPNTEFGNIFLRNDQGYHRITISAFDSPNFTDEHKTLPKSMTEKLVAKNWVAEKAKAWGVTDRRYLSRVLGEFPKQSFDALFTAETIAHAVDADRNVILQAFAAADAALDGGSSHSAGVLGVDVARFGTDLSVVVSNVGGIVNVEDSWAKEDTVVTAQKVDAIARRLGVREVRIDGVGVGAGVVDQLTHIQQNVYTVIEINGGGESPDIKQWYNYRAFLYDNLKTLMQDGKISLPAPESADDEAQIIQDELQGVRYKFLRGAMLIESKDDIRKRGGKSPDYADALTYACAPFDVDDPFAGYAAGDTGSVNASDVIADELLAGAFAISPY